ncbi:hypothetical protein SEA_ROOTS515_235 [Mycobacterium phage Roots515]|nr:hypothetical protein SEA_ROOTS515_235 [Mycobacterium phage Roots515]UTQ78002.1 hypothetical protein [Mycolicibacterium phage Kashi_SSH1]
MEKVLRTSDMGVPPFVQWVSYSVVNMERDGDMVMAADIFK